MRKSVTNQKVKAYNMRRFFIMFSFLWMTFTVILTNNLEAQVCCPEFKLKDAVEICPPEGACHKDGTNPIPGTDRSETLAACKESVHVYTVYPNDPGFTYTWTVTGGTPTNFTGNPNAVLWGTGSSGLIKVVISNLAMGGNCLDSITREVCLIDGPKADFNLVPSPVCLNSPVHLQILLLVEVLIFGILAMAQLQIWPILPIIPILHQVRILLHLRQLIWAPDNGL